MFSINPCYDLMPSSVDIYAMAERSSYEGSALCLDPSAIAYMSTDEGMRS